MLNIRNLTLTHKKDLTNLIENLSLTVNKGERLALIGEEGNGKTTLLKVIAGDHSVSSYIEVSGQINNTFVCGYLPQELPAGERMLSAYEFFCEEERFYDCSQRELGELAASLSLSSDIFYSEQTMASFSGGERVKMQLARMMMASPQMLLLDEPSNDLDIQTVKWLEDFLVSCGLTVLFVSHDEHLLRRAATGVILLERLRRRQVPRASVCREQYEKFTVSRRDLFEKQERIARKEREEFDKKMQQYRQIRQRVEHEQNTVSRQDPMTGRLLKKKMHAVTSMGKRFEREQQDMTAMPECEEAIFAKLSCSPLPPSKTVLDLHMDRLCIGDKVLSKDIHMNVRAVDKICITGRNGVGKSTLLRAVHDNLRCREDLKVFYMPQDPGDMLDDHKTPLEMMEISGDKEERVRNAVALGSMNFTAEEMNHPCAGLSGGQKAKLMFLMMACSQANVLLLDEPTRNLSPLSGPVVRALFEAYNGSIIAVSHDRAFAQDVCTKQIELTVNGCRIIEKG